MTMQITISYFFYGMAVISLFSFILLVVVYWKRERNAAARLQKTRDDIGDIADIFRTMRDILDQQKQHAREFNEEIDAKMAVVKQVLSQSLDRNEELYERQRLLSRELDTTALELKSMHHQIEELDQMVQNGRAMGRRKLRDAQQSIAGPPVPEAPANPEKARNAFRALLEMKESEEQETQQQQANDTGTAVVADKSATDATMETTPSTLKQIEMYSAEGMSVSEIADKLGIGKGEVQMMLSLKNRNH